jgi:hypothetical protein
MKKTRLSLILLMLFIALFSLSAAVVIAEQSDLAQVRAATARFHQPEAAQAAGWELVGGLDYCFEDPDAGAMGFHYINTAKLDATIEILQPEAMVYAPGRDGRLALAAVEYIVPVSAWEAAGHSGLPQALGHEFHLNEGLGVYVLHAWIWRHNPAGLFEDWNPLVTCP